MLENLALQYFAIRVDNEYHQEREREFRLRKARVAEFIRRQIMHIQQTKEDSIYELRGIRLHG